MPLDDEDLYGRGVATLLAAWEQYARGSAGAALLRLNGVSAAVFPGEPERAFFNNALFDGNLGPTERAVAADAMEAAYDTAGIDGYAAWVHERERGMQDELTGRGYAVVETTRAMGMALGNVAAPPGDVDLVVPDWGEYVRTLGVPAGFLGGADPGAFHVVVARVSGRNVGSALAFDHDGDCGVFNVTTLPDARRRGLGTALTVRLLRDAVERGCTSASLQATPMAERLYGAIGFRDLGEFFEYAPRAVEPGALD